VALELVLEPVLVQQLELVQQVLNYHFLQIFKQDQE
jgi:hypothetical protein